MISKRFRKGMSILCVGLMITTGMSGCGIAGGSKKTVAVQSVSSLMGLNMAGANAYCGVVESKTTQAVQKDPDKVVKKCNVKVGDQVKVGDVLFEYDVDELNLTIQSKKLEIEQIQSGLVSSKNQIAELTKERNAASANEKLSYTLEIQEIELEMRENEYSLKSKQSELKKLEQSLVNTAVKSEVNGVVQTVNEDSQGYVDDDMYGDGNSSNAYITIMETGTYQIKGTASESSIYDLYLDMPCLIRSRSDKTKTWNGRISKIDTDSPAADNNNEDYYYDEGSSGESASKYAFYVDLEDGTDILMGQHVYLMPYEEGTYSPETITLASSFFTIEENEDGTTTSWCYVASEEGKIEKREVTLSPLNEETDTYMVLSGLTVDDYIASALDAPDEGTTVVMFDSDDHTVYSQNLNGDGTDETGESGDEMMNEDGEYYDEEGIDNEGEFIDEEGMDGEGEEGAWSNGEQNEGDVIDNPDDNGEVDIIDDGADPQDQE